MYKDSERSGERSLSRVLSSEGTSDAAGPSSKAPAFTKTEEQAPSKHEKLRHKAALGLFLKNVMSLQEENARRLQQVGIRSWKERGAVGEREGSARPTRAASPSRCLPSIRAAGIGFSSDAASKTGCRDAQATSTSFLSHAKHAPSKTKKRPNERHTQLRCKQSELLPREVRNETEKTCTQGETNTHQSATTRDGYGRDFPSPL